VDVIETLFDIAFLDICHETFNLWSHFFAHFNGLHGTLEFMEVVHVAVFIWMAIQAQSAKFGVDLRDGNPRGVHSRRERRFLALLIGASRRFFE